MATADWKHRARALGLKQRTIAALLGRSEEWVSRRIAAEPPIAIRTVIAAWQAMTPAQRGDVLLTSGLGRLLVWSHRQRLVTPGEDEAMAVVWLREQRQPAAPPLLLLIKPGRLFAATRAAAQGGSAGSAGRPFLSGESAP